MARPALYRLYRPHRFADVVGQTRTVATLRAAVAHGRLTHAYLFSGPRGTGKTSVARILAQAVNCENPQAGEPCGQCSSCLAAGEGRHLDIIEVDAASNRGIDEIRDIKERLAHQPVMGRVKTYIIDEVHMLTAEAFNALLKTLEEPPEHVMFILATTEPQKLPATVVSRCQRYEFERLSTPVIARHLGQVLDQEGIEYQLEALEILADGADGALRDALSLADQALAESGPLTVERAHQLVGSLDRSRLDRLLTAFWEGGPPGVASALAEAYHEGAEVRQILRDMARSLRDLMIFRNAGPEPFPGYRQGWLRQWAERVPSEIGVEAWVGAIEALAEAEGRLRGGFPPLLVAELGLYKAQRILQLTEPSRLSPPPPPVEVPLNPENPEPEPVEAPRSSPPAAAEASQALPANAGWAELLKRLRRTRRTLWALLQQAEVAQTGERVVITFRYPAHRDLFSSAETKAFFEGAFRQVYGPDVTYEVRVAGEEPVAAIPDPKEVKERVRRTLGDEVRLSGFDG